MTPAEVADVLDQCIRAGAAIDSPEGARYITISDTLAKILAADLRAFVLVRASLSERSVVIDPRAVAGLTENA